MKIPIFLCFLRFFKFDLMVGRNIRLNFIFYLFIFFLFMIGLFITAATANWTAFFINFSFFNCIWWHLWHFIVTIISKLILIVALLEMRWLIKIFIRSRVLRRILILKAWLSTSRLRTILLVRITHHHLILMLCLVMLIEWIKIRINLRMWIIIQIQLRIWLIMRRVWIISLVLIYELILIYLLLIH